MIVEKKGEEIEEGKRCLIIDDSLSRKTGKAIEFAGKLWDHVDTGYTLGLRLLLLFFMIAKVFAIGFLFTPGERQNEQKLYGLTKKQLKRQHTKCRIPDSKGDKRGWEVDMSKTDMAVIMIRKAICCLKYFHMPL